MHRFTLLLLPLLVFFCSPMCAQKELLSVKFSTFRHPGPGYFLFGPNSPDSIGLIDHSGKNVLATSAINAATVGFADSTITHFLGNKRVFVRRNAHMQVVDTLRLEGTYMQDFHEGHMLSNGNYVVLGFDVRPVDMSVLVPGGRPDAKVTGAVIQERTLTGTTVFEWKSLDHIPVTDVTEDIELLQPGIDYIHVNAVVEDTDGNFLVSCRHLDEIIKINRSTGAVMWRLGGSASKGNQFTFLNDNVGFTGFSHQHDVFRTAGGRIMMMDNGNLKDTPYSRAVEYEIDETLKTARLTWSFRPSPDIFVPTMGSVQETENGNIVIGWGNSQSPIIAHEVSRDGTIQAEIRFVGIRISSYRVRKAVFAMSGAERAVTSPGTYMFTRGDSNTRITMALTRVDAATSIITERHSFAPRNLDFTASAPCVPLPMRWVVRVRDTSKIAGTTKFLLGGISMVGTPSRVKLYHRPTEGIGKFSEVTVSFDSVNKVFNTAFIRPGEYALAYPMCYDPTPVSPANAATNVSLAPDLLWAEGLQTHGYDVEVYKNSNPTPIVTFSTFHLDTSIAGLEAGELYSWRVRARRPNPGPWSAFSFFRTRLNTPVLIAPTSLPDSVAVDSHPTFTWNEISAATSYTLQVFVLGSNTLVIDTVLSRLSYLHSSPFEHHTWYRWRVRATLDSVNGPWSSYFSFVTPPATPSQLKPLSEALDEDPTASVLEWTSVNGGLFYHVRFYSESATEPVLQDTVSSSGYTATELSAVTRYYWEVRAISRYGASSWSAKRWFLTRGASTLLSSILISPVNVQNVDTTSATLVWSPVEGATRYIVELTTKLTFIEPDFEWANVNENTIDISNLESGRLYRWRVLPLSADASGPWSSIGQFSTVPGPDDGLRPLTPADGSVDIRIQGSATFVTASRFTTYRAEFATDHDFTQIAHAIEGSISPLPYFLAEGTEYWWRIVGLRNSQDIDTGMTARFVTVSPVAVPDNKQPENAPVVRVSGRLIEVRSAIRGSRLQVFDVIGRRVLSTDVSETAGSSTHSVDHLTPGTFIAVLTTPFGSITSITFLIGSSFW